MDSLAWALYDLNRDRESLAVFNEILEQNPASPWGLAGLGWFAFFDEEYTKAVSYLEEATASRLTGKNFVLLALSRYRTSVISLDEAVLQVEAGLALVPRFDWGWRELGWLLEDGGELEKALEAFETAVNVNPENKFGHYGVAWVQGELSNWQETLDAATRALELDADYAAALSRRSLAYFKLGHSRKALQDGETLVELRPGEADGYVRKARAQDALGWRRLALDTLQKAEAQVGFSPYMIYWRASLLHDEQDYPAALTQLDRIFEDAGTVPDFHDLELRALVALDMGNLELSRASADQALALEKENPWAWYLEARLLLAEGHSEDSVQAFAKAMELGLPRDQVKTFVKRLVRYGQFLKAISVKGRYSES
ncbi:tetratricopeptide repeat protein [Leisingera sp. ANG-M1]|uniref:tetratricopeptide repeat protein n=1 Tax=Leisingera sp. ANG-M1 TaxID=1577895 RepID=UPI00187CA13A|nr:tetratricopeptide repeat protein [Leisingera sp. ANG-M1]